MSRHLPPFGKQFQPIPRSGIRVALGPGAWVFVKTQPPTMVLPDDTNADDFQWPSDGKPALIQERGEANSERLKLLATELIIAGASSVVAIRESLLDAYDARVFFDREVTDVAA